MRIAIVDQSPAFRLGVKFVIQRFLPETQFLEASCAFAIEASAPPPAVAFLSLDEIENDAKSLISISQRLAHSIVIGTTSNPQGKALARGATAAFIRDIIPKTASLERITASCARAVISLPHQSRDETDPAQNTEENITPLRLPPRHLETLRHLTDGHSNQQIAEQMSISVNTVRIYVSAVLRSLNASNRTQAALIGRRILSDAASQIFLPDSAANS